jgi:hypothetical protein
VSVATADASEGTAEERALLERLATRPRSRNRRVGAQVGEPGRLPTLPYQMVAHLQASNGPVYIHPQDRKYGVLAAGGQGSGKTALQLRLYQSDIRDPNASPIIIDPKSELAQLALEHTPPDCGKRVWWLDLGRPMFGMSPLRLDPSRSLAEQASSVADNVVQAISDTAEGQVFQSSRRYLYHAIVGALALAHQHDRLATFEDVFALLLPSREDVREAAVNACQAWADLDHTTEFFSRVLPEELDSNRANTHQRLDPPRNKLEAILASPSLRRFYNHPVDITLREIVLNRDILLIDANMASLGEGNSQVVMHLVIQQINALMQELIHLPPQERPRVPVDYEEAGNVVKMNTVKQFATHREAGLEPVMGVQYLSQLGADAESPAITEAIRKGVMNLMQSRCLFRMGDPEDAEKQSRIGMSVYQTMIRGDLESRELMGAPPEKSLYLPVHYCLASWIVGGARIELFLGETFEFEKLRGGRWAEHHLRVLEEAVGAYPEKMPRTYQRPPDPATPTATPPAARKGAARERPAPRTPTPTRNAGTTAESERGAQRPVQPLIRPAGEVPEVKRSPVRKVIGVGRAPAQTQQLFSDDEQAPESLRELALFVDPLLGIKKAERSDPAEELPKLFDEDYAVLALLDRVGFALPGMIRRAVLPGVAERTLRDRLHGKLHRHGLIERWPIILRDKPRGGLPFLYSLTRFGMQTAQQRQPPAIPEKREFREIEVEKDGRIRHDLHLEAWVIAFHTAIGRLASDKWRTPRWPAGTCALPHIGNGRSRRTITLKDVRRPKHIGIFDVDSAHFATIAPDAILEVKVPDPQLTIDLCVEMDLTDRTSYNREKFCRYDAFLCAWWSEHRRYRQLGVRPAVVFVCRTPELALSYARAADEEMYGSIGVTGSASHERYYAGREHLFFATESDIYNGSLAALALPPLPPLVRSALDGETTLAVERVNLIDERLVREATLPLAST